MKKLIDFTVTENKRLNHDTILLVLHSDELPDIQPGQFVNAYIDELNNLGLHEQIRDDIGNNFVMQYCNELPEEAVSILKNRYKEIVVNPKYLKEIEHVFQNVLP